MIILDFQFYLFPLLLRFRFSFSMYFKNGILYIDLFGFSLLFRVQFHSCQTPLTYFAHYMFGFPVSFIVELALRFFLLNIVTYEILDNDKIGFPIIFFFSMFIGLCFFVGFCFVFFSMFVTKIILYSNLLRFFLLFRVQFSSRQCPLRKILCLLMGSPSIQCFDLDIFGFLHPLGLGFKVLIFLRTCKSQQKNGYISQYQEASNDFNKFIVY